MGIHPKIQFAQEVLGMIYHSNWIGRVLWYMKGEVDDIVEPIGVYGTPCILDFT